MTEETHVCGNGFKEYMLHGKADWCIILQFFLLKGFLKLLFSKSYKITYATFGRSQGGVYQMNVVRNELREKLNFVIQNKLGKSNFKANCSKRLIKVKG